MNSPVLLELREIHKEFSGVEVLHGINFSANKGEVHALVGENGAGKSTLMKILSGYYPGGSYSGEIFLDEKPARFSGIKAAAKAGIELISQELELVQQLKVYENIFLGNEILNHGVLDVTAMMRESQAVFQRFAMQVDCETQLSEMGVGQRQMVAIAKALVGNVRIIVFDEPTAALTEVEAEKLFQILEDLKTKGITSIYISHRLGEVMHVADRITVLRDGNTIITDNRVNMDENKMICYMVGREITDRYPRIPRIPGHVVLDVRNISAVDADGRPVVRGVDLTVRAGEIVGIAGLMGAGRSELVRCIFGDMSGQTSGQIYIENREIRIRSPHNAIENGIALVTEDRKYDGILPGLSILFNITVANLKALSPKGVMDDVKAETLTQKLIKELSIRAPHADIEVERLSGGNQQKVCIARFLMVAPKVLILDEPTRGVDVGAKYEIYTIISRLAQSGVGILIVSSELPEVIGVSDRVLVMREGIISGELSHEEANPDRVMYYATRKEEKECL